MVDEHPEDGGAYLERLADFLRAPPAGDFLEFQQRWWSGPEIAAAGRRLDALLQQAGVPTTMAVGVLVRNHVGHAAAIFGLAGSGRSILSLSTMLPDPLVVEDITRLGLGVVIAEESDWTETLRACLADGRIGIAFPDGGVAPYLVSPGALREDGCLMRDSFSVGLLTSGTTGAPKRIELGAGALMRGYDMMAVAEPSLVGTQVDIHGHHISSIGGMLPLLTYAAYRLPFCLLEKLELWEWLHAVRRHGSRSMGVAVPIVRALLTLDVPAKSLASAEILYGGGGALDPETIGQVERTFDLKICWGYGATEFAGTLTSWTRALRIAFDGEKAGSVGKPLPGVGIRVTDPDTGEPRAAGAQGRLEALIPSMSEAWIRTNDLAQVDDDGFLYVLGRLDGAINRGGFKVLPDTVATALRRHPAVADAAVFGLPDARLGEIPVAAIELKPDAQPVTGEDIRNFSREHLAAPSVPAEVRIFRPLPRTLTMKVDMPRLRGAWANGTA